MSDFSFSICNINGYHLFNIEITHFFENKDIKQKNKWDFYIDIFWVRALLQKLDKRSGIEKFKDHIKK